MALAVPGENLPRHDERYHILVASPGKLHELIRNLNQDITQYFEYTTYMVVDEADHLLKDGEKDGADLTIQIMRQLRPDIQMLYFTATWDESLPSQIGKVFKSNYGSREPWLCPVEHRFFFLNDQRCVFEGTPWLNQLRRLLTRYFAVPVGVYWHTGKQCCFVLRTQIFHHLQGT